MSAFRDMERDQAAIEATGAQLDAAGPTEATIKRDLADLDRVAYDRQRETLAEQYGIRAPTLDKLFKESQRADDQGNGAALELDDAEPWAEPVNGDALLREIVDTLIRYVSLPDNGADAVALWIAHTYLHDAAAVSPILAVTSATKRCGKSTLLQLLKRLTRRPLPADNITYAALFRSIEKWRPSLLIDEADTFIKESDELRGVLNSGHRHGGTVIRTVGDDHEPRVFSTWAPKAIALIGNLPDTLADRSINITMRRRTAGEKVERIRATQSMPPIAEKLTRWATDNFTRVHTADPEPPDHLNDRAADNWRPLLAIAETVGGEWPSRALKSIHALEGEIEDDSASTMLLADIKALFDQRDHNRITSKALAGYLETLEHRPWPEWCKGNPITQRQIARLLEPFGIKPELFRIGDGRGRGYKRSAFTDAFTRYFPAQSVTPCHPLGRNGYSDSQSVTANNAVTDRKKLQPLGGNGCHGVTGENPATGAVSREVL